MSQSVRLLRSDCHGPRPAGHLPWGVFAFCCTLCGEPVMLVPADGPKIEGETALAFPIHGRCRELTSAALVSTLIDLATAQRRWELRAQLN